MLPPPKRNALYKLHALKTWQSPDVCRVAVLQQQHKSPPGVDDFLPEPNKFQHLDVLVSTDPQLNFPSHVPSFSSLLQHTRRPPTSNDDHALIAVHWSAVILSNTNVNNSPTHEAEPPNVQEQEDATVLATVVQYESPWLLVKLPLLNDVEDANWTVLQGWIHVASPCVSLLVCHDPDTQNLFDELKGLQIMVVRPAIPMDASVISALIDASRTATTTTAPLATAATSKAVLRYLY
ncbi:hypothetical protein DYB25_009620 [Aphanomyces astaci]|uniref:Uncharacterized protein n=1 Tax=Aphanomyces astaci TaxID=112090 RepID=A0A397AC38_APHAT|nr:hypothetical protein DYB25_009620 [Aphanomyces astaci]